MHYPECIALHLILIRSMVSMIQRSLQLRWIIVIVVKVECKYRSESSCGIRVNGWYYLITPFRVSGEWVSDIVIQSQSSPQLETRCEQDKKRVFLHSVFQLIVRKLNDETQCKSRFHIIVSVAIVTDRLHVYYEIIKFQCWALVLSSNKWSDKMRWWWMNYLLRKFAMNCYLCPRILALQLFREVTVNSSPQMTHLPL